MKIKKTIALALENIFANRVRSVLTSLGIIIGAATIVVVIAVGAGAQAAIARQYSNLSVTSVFIMGSGPGVTNSRLSAGDAAVILERCPSVRNVAPQLFGRTVVNQGTTSEQYSVVGTTPGYQEVINLGLEHGRFFTEDEVKSRARVVVVGATVAEDLLEDINNPEGEFLRINGRKFEVIGVTGFKGGSVGPINLDESIYMPYTIAEKQVLGESARASLSADVKSIDVVAQALEEIKVALRDEHRLTADKPDDFRVLDVGANLQAAQDSSRTMGVLLVSIAAIVLLVSGIGIMNIMLVTVTERTREIGVRKAVGARRKDILRQFLVEAILVSCFGGIVGVVLGVSAIPIVSYLEVEAMQSPLGVVIAFAFSILFGVFFGYYPAQKASRLDPIVALRYE